MYFLNINKPKNKTSFDVVRHLRKMLNIHSIGHSGTLDPLASGVLQIAVGSATKLLDYLPSDKKYIAEIIFGYVSDTYDDEGEKVFVSEPKFSVHQLELVLNSFIGKTFQIPPKYSAIKINGQKLCNIARKNPDKSIEIPSREINIYEIKLLEFNNTSAKIEVFCEKGVYIRSLVNDIGNKLGCGAYVSELTRTQAGDFNLDNSDSLDGKFTKINPLDALKFDKYELSNDEYLKISNGNFIPYCSSDDGKIILLTKDNTLVSLAKISDNLIKPKKFFGRSE